MASNPHYTNHEINRKGGRLFYWARDNSKAVANRAEWVHKNGGRWVTDRKIGWKWVPDYLVNAGFWLIDPNGVEHFFLSMTDFQERTGLSGKIVNYLTSGARKSLHGWRTKEILDQAERRKVAMAAGKQERALMAAGKPRKVKPSQRPKERPVQLTLECIMDGSIHEIRNMERWCKEHLVGLDSLVMIKKGLMTCAGIYKVPGTQYAAHKYTHSKSYKAYIARFPEAAALKFPTRKPGPPKGTPGPRRASEGG